MELFVRPDGQVEALYEDGFEFAALGEPSIRRASVVEPSPAGAWTADLAPVQGPVLGPFTCRNDALDAERRWLTGYRLENKTSRFLSESHKQGETPDGTNLRGNRGDLPGVSTCCQLRHAHGHDSRPDVGRPSNGTWGGQITMIVAGGILLVLVCAYGVLVRQPAVVPGPAPSLSSIQALQQLITHRVLIRDVRETRVAGHTGSIVVTVVVQGDVLVGVDLQKARVLRVDTVRREMQIALPLPEGTSPRVDHDHTHVQRVEWTGLWQLAPGTVAQALVVDQALRKAQESVERSGDDPAVQKSAQDHTEEIIGQFGRNLGWTIHVLWGRLSIATCATR